MKPYFILNIALFFLIIPGVRAQKSYTETVTEFIFSFSVCDFTEDFHTTYPQAEVMKTNLRFTAFLHISQDWHMDFNNNLGIITGFGLRNVGLISDEVLPDTENDSLMRNFKIIRRLYTLGVPLSVKIGSFKDHFFLYAGGELELALHFKEKYWSDSKNRSGDKTVYTSWFGEQTPLILPSVFAGVQLPRGFNIKFKYYLRDFLDHNYKRNKYIDSFSVSDLTRYNNSQVFYFSLSWQFNTAYLKTKNWNPDKKTVAIR
jgi:hypothetical protein